MPGSGGILHPLDVVVDTTKRAVTSAPPTDAYLKWDSPGVEVIQPDEDATTDKIAQVMTCMQKHNFDRHRHCFRATHVKTQGIVKGKLKVHDDLPAHLRQGIFTTPGREYDVAARYANEPYLLQDDKEVGPRGLGLKVFGVSGDRLDPAHDHSTTQDFLFNNAPTLELTDLPTTLDIMSLREKHFDNPTALGAALKLRTDQVKQHGPYALPNTNIISHEMFTQSAFRFGDHYGHMALFPSLDAMQAKADEDQVDSSKPYGVLGDWLFDWFEGKEAKYDFKIQLGTSPTHHPTEDASVIWSESTAPYQSLATLTFPPQDSFSHPRRVFWEENMALSPWRGIEAHRPLGSVNRLRKRVYARSRETRERINDKSGVWGGGEDGKVGGKGREDGGDVAFNDIP